MGDDVCVDGRFQRVKGLETSFCKPGIAQAAATDEPNTYVCSFDKMHIFAAV
ncbi:hypothetical protein [Oxalicibacterium faecigallinarum]|uniref:hypothetical protein n=1 Tax=Oxalicibacterium faecigallinarum TaxID=573741 RepID=UPI00166BEA4D|nr:hypothetical protein [Oxalicibacterium faecigallinarum]